MSAKRYVQARAKKIRKFFGLLGPGLTTGAADDDPSGIATYFSDRCTIWLWTIMDRTLYAPIYDRSTGSLCKNRNGYR
jgi:hypothetical protein